MNHFHNITGFHLNIHSFIKRFDCILPEEKIITKHPSGKTGRSVSKSKYEQMKQAILNALQKKDYSYSELVSILESSLKDKFFDNISWYVETVLLDLEARGIVKKSTKYHII